MSCGFSSQRQRCSRWSTVSKVAQDKFRRWNWRLFLRDRGAKASGLTEGIPCVCSGRVLFSAGSKRPLSQDCDHELRPCRTSSLDRYWSHTGTDKHTSRRSFPSTRHEQQFCSTMTMNDSSHFVSLHDLHWGVVVTYRKV